MRVQGSNQKWQVEMPKVRLEQIAARSRTVRGQIAPSSPFLPALDRDMFLATWASTVRAAASVLEQAQPDDSATIAEGMRCLRMVRADHSPPVCHTCLLCDYWNATGMALEDCWNSRTWVAYQNRLLYIA